MSFSREGFPAIGVVPCRRRADGLVWHRVQRREGTTQAILKDVVPDNHVFAVASVDADGNESLPVGPSKLE